jgi:hypothetical protein
MRLNCRGLPSKPAQNAQKLSIRRRFLDFNFNKPLSPRSRFPAPARPAHWEVVWVSHPFVPLQRRFVTIQKEFRTDRLMSRVRKTRSRMFQRRHCSIARGICGDARVESVHLRRTGNHRLVVSVFGQVSAKPNKHHRIPNRPAAITLVKSANRPLTSIGNELAKALSSKIRFPDLGSLSKHCCEAPKNGYPDLDC